MVVGIIGILAAVAIPAYQNYQKNARIGVVESILRTAQRTWKVEESLGRTISSLSGSHLWAKVESRDKSSFDDSVAAGFSKGTNKWCLKIEGKSASDYDKFGGCVDQAGSLLLAGQDSQCSTASQTYACAGSPLRYASSPTPSTCPTNCTGGTALTGTCTSDGTVSCVPAAENFYVLDIGDINCSGGECEL